jgi:hypothetical protein
MKQDDYVSEGGKQHSTSSFSFSTNKFLSFFVSKMSAEESFVEKLQQKSREKLQNSREQKQKRQNEQ